MRSLAFLLALALPSLASAKAQSELPGYRLEEVFSTALRFVRVDRGCKVTDKDADAAFVMFECPADNGHTSKGAVEVFRANKNGREGVRLTASLPDEGHGPELRLVELIERKLREERGTPTAPKPPAPPSPPDAGVKP